MSEINLIFTPKLTLIDAITLDASIKETHKSTVEITEHPVEDGAVISDHARTKPAEITIEGMISNTPVTRDQETRIIENAGVQIETTSVQDAILGAPGYAEQIFAQLETLRDTHKLMDVTTGVKSYTNMGIVSLEIPRDAKSGDAIFFSISLKEVRLVKNQTTTQVVAAEPKAKKKVSTGKQPAAEASDEMQKSWLKTGTDSVGFTNAAGGL